MRQFAILAAAAATLAFAAFTLAPFATDTYKVDAAASKVNWEGSKPTGKHNGTINITEGNVVIEKGAITGGSFTFDMNSIDSKDLTGEYKGKLEGHLKSADFFDVAKFPKGTFVIKSVKKAPKSVGKDAFIITGDLTLRDVTKPVSFGATVTMKNGRLVADAKSFKIDRKNWGVTFHSGTIAATLKDQVIYDEMSIGIHLEAAKEGATEAKPKTDKTEKKAKK